MNIFILNSGRCGSTTFIKACKHITNYSSAHESLITKIGAERLAYPKNHIEADNRLSWFLGRLDTTYANDAFYVHLKREQQETAKSFSKRIDFGILKAYEQGILMHEQHQYSSDDIALDYIKTIDSNIELFLKDKSNKMGITLDSAVEDFTEFWSRINASGNLNNALQEWDIRYNAS